MYGQVPGSSPGHVSEWIFNLSFCLSVSLGDVNKQGAVILFPPPVLRHQHAGLSFSLSHLLYLSVTLTNWLQFSFPQSHYNITWRTCHSLLHTHWHTLTQLLFLWLPMREARQLPWFIQLTSYSFYIFNYFSLDSMYFIFLFHIFS